MKSIVVSIFLFFFTFSYALAQCIDNSQLIFHYSYIISRTSKICRSECTYFWNTDDPNRWTSVAMKKDASGAYSGCEFSFKEVEKYTTGIRDGYGVVSLNSNNEAFFDMLCSFNFTYGCSGHIIKGTNSSIILVNDKDEDAELIDMRIGYIKGNNAEEIMVSSIESMAVLKSLEANKLLKCIEKIKSNGGTIISIGKFGIVYKLIANNDYFIINYSSHKYKFLIKDLRSPNDDYKKILEKILNVRYADFQNDFLNNDFEKYIKLAVFDKKHWKTYFKVRPSLILTEKI